VGVAINYKQRKNHKKGVVPSKGSVSKTSQSGRKRVAAWFLGLAAVAITAFVTAYATNLGNITSSWIENLFPPTGLPVRIDSVGIMHVGNTHAFANALVLSNNEFSQLNSLNQTDPSYEAWFASRHAVDTNRTIFELVVEGNRNHTVRITDIQPIVSCQPPLKGTLFFSPYGGADTSTQLLLDLDNPHAVPSYIGENGTSGKDFFGTHTVSLRQGEQFTFEVVASTTKHFCKFTLAMTVLDGDKTVTENVTNNGQPFQVTAMLDNNPTKPGEFSAYQVLYIVGPKTNSFGDFEWDRANPNTFPR